MPSSAAVTVQTSEAPEVQTYFKPKKIPAQLRKYDRLILDVNVDGMMKAECEKGKDTGYRAWLLFKIGAVGDEMRNIMK